MTVPYDDIPMEVRRLKWGWFGPPWWSYVCYDEDGRLIEEMHIDAPLGEKCIFCQEVIEDGHSGEAMPCETATGASIGYAHKECLLRNVLGPPEHLDGRCTCRDPDRTPRPYREEALELWDRISRR